MLTMRQLMFGVFDLTIHGIKPDEVSYVSIRVPNPLV